MTMKPWREVILPHEDVLDGKFDESEFAADLTKVVRGIAKPEYQDAVRFFERTVITEGMSLLLQSVVKRLAGQGGDPVVQLQTAFGGGKTHTMMAVMHVAAGSVPASAMLGVSELLDKAKVKELVKARVAVLDGNELAPSQPQEHGKIMAHTLWGELAWQIGREDGYALVADSDTSGTSPGKDVLARLLERFGPVVILMDETVAYLRQLEAGKSYKGGTFNSNLSFLQALTEAVSRVPNAMLLASLPESMMEVGDNYGQQVLDSCQKTFGRIEAIWKPVGTDEAFEIVRRRVFKPVQDQATCDAVCRAFSDLYVEHGDKFPAETKDGAYQGRIKASYPIHPEVFERLYEDWSTLPKFQRTRGVLRLMARLVHSLWRDDNRDYLILPGSIPLSDTNVRNELIKYLPQGWDPIVDKDIDGTNAEPRRIDDDVSALGSVQACRRAARTIFLGSAPSVSGQKVRGIGVERVRLGCAQPGQSPARYDDALRRLSDRLHYLYSGNDRYWFDQRPNLRREMETRMQRFDPKLHVHPEIQERLQKLVKASVFQGVHIFAESKDIPDKVDLRLVVLDPEACHKRKDESSKAVQAAEAILTKHGDKPREYQNRVLFLAADVNAVGPLREHVRRYLAWKSIVDDADQLNLDKHHEKEAKKSLDEAAARVEGSIREAYRFLLAPHQQPESGSKIEWEDDALALSNSSYDKAITSAVREKEWVIPAWAPTHMHALLKQWFWKPDQPAVGAKKVWLDTCRYLYLPRLAEEDVFSHTVRDGVGHKDWFGYAAAKKDASYQGLLFGASGTIYLDDEAVLLHPEEALAALPKPQPVLATVGGGDGPAPIQDPYVASASTASAPQASAPKAEGPIYRRFHGTVEVVPASPIDSFTEIVDSVIQHFTSKYGTSVSITVDIEARRDEGFEQKTVRTVRENANVLKFMTAEFEEE
jgi:uncharacterized protein